MLKIILLTLLVFPSFSLDINKIYSEITKTHLEIYSKCFQELDINSFNPSGQNCDHMINLVKKVKNNKNLNRSQLCHRLKIAYANNKPEYCKIIYCSPCIFREI
jgi:hypothetical protein